MTTALEWGSVIAAVGVLLKAIQIGGNWVDDKIKARSADRQTPYGGCDEKTHDLLDRVADLLEKQAEANARAASNLERFIAVENERNAQAVEFRHRLEEKVHLLIREVYATGVKHELDQRRKPPG